jgi:hypothetical protein
MNAEDRKVIESMMEKKEKKKGWVMLCCWSDSTIWHYQSIWGYLLALLMGNILKNENNLKIGMVGHNISIYYNI